MAEIGYVRIHRTLLGHPAFRNDSEALAFAWMVIRAAWKPVRVRYKEQSISLDRGQLAISVRDMATHLDRDKAWIERLWKRLKRETMIETAVETGVTVVTICKYADYQSDLKKRETPTKTPRKTDVRQGQDTEQEGEKGKKEKEEEKPPTPLMTEGVEIPDWIPPEPWIAFVAMRNKKGASPTAHAVELLIAKLDRFRSAGHDPGAVLDNSTLNNWTGIFEPKEDRNGNRNQYPARDNRDGVAKELDSIIFGSGPGEPAGQTRRHDVGDGGGDSVIPIARARLL